MVLHPFSSLFCNLRVAVPRKLPISDQFDSAQRRPSQPRNYEDSSSASILNAGKFHVTGSRKKQRYSYAAVAVNISTLELVDDKSTRPNANTAVKSAINPKIIPIPCTRARTVIATVGKRHAITVVIIEVARTIQSPLYSVRLSSTEEVEEVDPNEC